MQSTESKCFMILENGKNTMNDEMYIEKIVTECIKVIESTNLSNMKSTSYDTSLVEATRQKIISNIEKRFNMKSTNF